MPRVLFLPAASCSAFAGHLRPCLVCPSCSPSLEGSLLNSQWIEIDRVPAASAGHQVAPSTQSVWLVWGGVTITSSSALVQTNAAGGGCPTTERLGGAMCREETKREETQQAQPARGVRYLVDNTSSNGALLEAERRSPSPPPTSCGQAAVCVVGIYRVYRGGPQEVS